MSAEWISAQDDGQAVEAARKMINGYTCELWERSRLVIRLPEGREV
jgi:hypothetical protein